MLNTSNKPQARIHIVVLTPEGKNIDAILEGEEFIVSIFKRKETNYSEGYAYISDESFIHHLKIVSEELENRLKSKTFLAKFLLDRKLGDDKLEYIRYDINDD